MNDAQTLGVSTTRTFQRRLPIARTLIPVSTARYMPFSAATGMLGISSATDTPESIAAALTPFQNAVLFGGYAFALLAIGTTLFYRRDTD